MKPLNIEVSSPPHPLIILTISTEPSFPPLSCPHPQFKPQKQPKAKKKGEKKRGPMDARIVEGATHDYQYIILLLTYLT
ncbi:hypothetical protein I7I48_07734 [Histoplasma ohiense]|nr:hypothetical protein I7I48_07734 [Histoplasma ohiense (nom. inval.)]